VEPRPDRTRALIEAGIALSSELSLDAVLQKLVETAAALTDARYAALGVLDPSGEKLERFITTGIDQEARTAIGDLPHGRGILGVLIHDPQPLRLHDLHADPRSVGFPPNHPPMQSFLGAPVNLRGVVYGNLYLTEKAGGVDFEEDDEATLVLLAGQAAVAIENARLYETATGWAAQLESLNEVMNALATEFDLDTLLELVAENLRELIGARLVAIALPHGDALRLAAVAGEGAGGYAGLELSARSKTMRVMGRRRSERVDSVLDDPEVEQEAARRLGARSALYVPLLVRDEAIGVIAVHDKTGADPRFGDADLQEDAGMAVDRSGNVYLSDQAGNRLQSFTASGRLRWTWKRTSNYSGLGVSEPPGVALDRAGNAYVVGSATYLVEKISPSGRQLSAWPVPGDIGSFAMPTGIAVDRQGSVYVVSTAGRIFKYSSSGKPLAIWK